MTQPLKGRGAVSNLAGRFEKRISCIEEEFLPEKRETQFFAEHAKSMLTQNQSPDIPFLHSLNPYRGCEHGCIYCFARPYHAYMELSPGLDFETKIFVKENAVEALRRDLSRPSYKCSPIAIGTATDPYQPVERERRITRSVLELLLECRHPLSIITKNHLITRDIDVLAKLAEQSLVRVAVSITTLDNQTKRWLEPRTSSGEARLRAVAALREAGVPVGVMVAPLIPWINDHETEEILARSVEAGADSANFILLRLPHEVAPLFQEWLQTHYPDRAERVLSTIRDARGGKLYDSKFGERMTGVGEYARLYSQRFHLACRKVGLNHNHGRGTVTLDCSRFMPPLRERSSEAKVNQKTNQADDSQMNLF
ncbi:MAG TPA: PA0069 family radical SAM protein [Dongiaceae bacterium]|nr:PA0069 family radical SAM protein [Dongiaceae bacterium]